MYNKLSENLKKIRKDNNLSQEDLAEELKVSRQAISKWESGSSYPEMEKILQICNRFNLNINDLLNNDIKEVKGEIETKNNINKYIDDFLSFISDSIDLFTSLKFKDKIRFIIEQLVIVGILVILFMIFGFILSNLFSNIIQILPNNIYYFTIGFIKDAIYIISVVIGLIVMLHLFKTRYLDYYKKSIIEEKEKEILVKKDSKEKIIIRDSKDNEYRFVNGLLKFIVLSIKIFAFFILLFVSLLLALLVILLVASFLISKTGLLFIGLIIALSSSIIITTIITLILINFIFNRKNNKKLLIILFVISLISMGIGLGLSFIGTLDFEVVNSYKSEIYNKKDIEMDMSDKLVIYNYKAEFVEEDRDNIKIEYIFNKYSDVNHEVIESDKYNIFNIYSHNTQEFKMIREYLKYINDKKILTSERFNVNIIKIYASSKNIETLKNNLNDYNN